MAPPNASDFDSPPDARSGLGVSKPEAHDGVPVTAARHRRLSIHRRREHVLPRMWSFRGRTRRLDSCPDHTNARRLGRLDTWSTAEILVLRELAERATGTADERVRAHPFQRYQRRLLRAVVDASSDLTVVPEPQRPTSPTSSNNRRGLKHLLVDYPLWRRKFFRREIDRRLRLRHRSFVRLFPAIRGLPHAITKRIFRIFDRNASGRVEFTELCENLARCVGRNNDGAEYDDRLDVIFEWFKQPKVSFITRQDVAVLETTYRSLCDDGPRSTIESADLHRELLRGQLAVSMEEFCDRLARLPNVVATLMHPFDIVTRVINEGDVLHRVKHHKWVAGEIGYLVAKPWWDKWSARLSIAQSRHFARVDTASPDSSILRSLCPLSGGSSTPGPISNHLLYEDGIESDAVLRPGLSHGSDFVLVSAPVWQKLHALYGGGPKIARKVVSHTTKADGHGGVQCFPVFIGDERSLCVDPHVYPISIRLTRTDAFRTTLVLSRIFNLSKDTTTKSLLYRMGLVAGVNVQSITVWSRRHRFDSWRQLDVDPNGMPAASTSLQPLSSHELLIDFRIFDSISNTSCTHFADNHLDLFFYRPVGNDFVCKHAGIGDSLQLQVLASLSATNDGNDCDRRNSTKIIDGLHGGNSGVIGSNGFLFHVNDHLGMKRRIVPRLILHPGIRATGLQNMGNTCFLNCALQCIGHSPVLREYFLSQRFLSDICKSNPLGTSGKIAIAYAKLMGRMWGQLDQRSSIAPASFRDEFTRCCPQFQESNQHDAHEFIVSMLDALHEDLNRKSCLVGRDRTRGGGCLPFYGSDSNVEISENVLHDTDSNSDSTTSISKESSSRSTASLDEAAGSQSWQSHAGVNASIVVDLFHGLTRSETLCHTCDERKVAFDPFSFFSLPIPEPKLCRVEVKIVLQVRTWNSDEVRSCAPTRRAFWLPRPATVGDLCAEIASAYMMEPRQFLIVEVRRHRIMRIFESMEPIEAITTHREVHAYERAPTTAALPETVEPIKTLLRATFEQLDSQPVATFDKLFVGARVDAVGFNGDWIAGSVVAITEGKDKLHGGNYSDQQLPADSQSCVQVHFDGFSSKWDKWYCGADWRDGVICPIHTRSSSAVEVFEAQVVHRVVRKRTMKGGIAYLNSSRRMTDNASTPDDGDAIIMDVFGLPMFVTIASNCSTQELHGAILQQASRFMATSDKINLVSRGGEIPYEVRIADLDDVTCVRGVLLPSDSTKILQHFSSQSVVVLDWVNPRLYKDQEEIADDFISPAIIAEFDSLNEHKENTTSWSQPTTTLSQCFDVLFQSEKIELDDYWICDRCGQPREGTRRSDVWRLPDLVMIQLKRFQYLENGHRQKVRTLVQFPLRGLDFSAWIGALQSETIPTCQGSNESYVYDLYAVANHVGGLARGHYTAYCKYDETFEESSGVFNVASAFDEVECEDFWVRFDDEKVAEIAAGDVVSDAAYVLFYKRRKLSPHNLLAYSL